MADRLVLALLTAALAGCDLVAGLDRLRFDAATIGPGAGGAGADGGAGGEGGEGNVCGDGTVQPPEQCDDSNDADGDGCSLGCEPEPVDGCAPAAAAIPLSPGDELLLSADTADASNDSACDCVVCTSGGAADVTYVLTPTAQGRVVATVASDHDAAVYLDLACPGDGSAICRAPGQAAIAWREVEAGDTVWLFVDGATEADVGPSELTVQLSVCGDGEVDPFGEECDDGNAVDDGNGCSADCEVSCPDADLEASTSHHCYTQLDTELEWQAARGACQAKGQGWDLVGIVDADELALLFCGNAGCWTGGNDLVTEGTYVWSNGEPFWRDAVWGADEPDGDTFQNCVRQLLNGIGGEQELRTEACDNPHYPLCELIPAGL